MRTGTLGLITIAVLLPILMAAAPTAKDDKAALQGVWNAQSIEADGKPGPAEAVRRMRFSFKGDKLLIRGNFNDDREEECTYVIDATTSPKHLDVALPDQKKPIPGIYEIKGDDLKICLRHASSSAGRPTEFSTKPESRLVLIVFKKAKAGTETK